MTLDGHVKVSMMILIARKPQRRNTDRSVMIEFIYKTYHINMTENNTELKVLLQFPYSEIQVVWMKQVIPKTAYDENFNLKK